MGAFYWHFGELTQSKLCWTCDKGQKLKVSYTQASFCATSSLCVANHDASLNSHIAIVVNYCLFVLVSLLLGLTCHSSLFSSTLPHSGYLMICIYQPVFTHFRVACHREQPSPVIEFSTMLSEKEENVSVSVCVCDGLLSTSGFRYFSQMLQIWVSSTECGLSIYLLLVTQWMYVWCVIQSYVIIFHFTVSCVVLRCHRLPRYFIKV